MAGITEPLSIPGSIALELLVLARPDVRGSQGSRPKLAAS
jgi:hypothetical protein